MGNIAARVEQSNSSHSFSDSVDPLAASKNYRKLFETTTDLPRIKPDESGDSTPKVFTSDFSIPKPSTLPTVFRWKKGGKTVYLMGSFDGWAQKYQLVPSDDEFMIVLDLPYGRHQYKFIVDGVWSYDPDEPVVDDNSNSFNNYILIQKSDNEIFKALSADEIQAINDDNAYSQEIPHRTPGIYYQRPPTVPPQLLQIVLNKDPPIRAEPAFLYTPTFAEINHLHAQSMKDGVVTLSSTYRYKKKFTTTVMYAPI